MLFTSNDNNLMAKDEEPDYNQINIETIWIIESDCSKFRNN